jgi:hypothetical protein
VTRPPSARGQTGAASSVSTRQLPRQNPVDLRQQSEPDLVLRTVTPQGTTSSAVATPRRRPGRAADPPQADHLEPLPRRGPAALARQPRSTPRGAAPSPPGPCVGQASRAAGSARPDPASGRCACRSPPRAEAVVLPVAPEVLEGSDAARTRPGATIKAQEPRHARVAVQGDPPLKVVVVPAAQQQAGGLDLAHRRTVAGGKRGDGTRSRILRLASRPGACSSRLPGVADAAHGPSGSGADRRSFTCVAGPRRRRPLPPAVAAAATATPGSAASSPPPPPAARPRAYRGPPRRGAGR